MECYNCGFDGAIEIVVNWREGPEKYIDCPCQFNLTSRLTPHSHASLSDFCDLTNLSKRGNYIFGPIGTGKTHLLNAIKKYCYFYNGNTFFYYRQIAEEILNFRPDMEKFESIRFLDEFDLPDKAANAQFFDRWLCNKFENCAPLFITSNMTLEIIEENYSKRLADRLRPYAVFMGGNSKRGTDFIEKSFKQKCLWVRKYREYINNKPVRKYEKRENMDSFLKLDIIERCKRLREINLKKERSN